MLVIVMILRFLFLDGGRDGLQSNFWQSFMSTSKPFQKRFHVVYSETSVRALKQQKSATGVSQDRGCLNLAQLESACVAAGRSLLSVVGQNRPNKLHQGTTASNVLMQVSKPDLSKLTKVEPSLKRTLLGSALVKDPSRSKVEEHAAEEAEPLNFHVMSHEFLPPGF